MSTVPESHQDENSEKVLSVDMEYSSSVVKLKTTEDILEKLGGFSYFQIIATIVLISPELSSSMISLSPVLTTSSHVSPYYCRTVDIDGPKFNRTFQLHELCDIDNHFHQFNHSQCQEGTIVPTQPYTSIIQEWQLVCDKFWIPDFLTSIQMFGGMMGSLISGQMADKYGRKRVFFILIFFMSLFNFLGGLAPKIMLYSLTRFFTGFAVGGCFVVYLNYLIEFLTPRYRAICGCCSLWGAGEMMLAILGYSLPCWRHLSLVTSVPLLSIFLFYKFLPESPRWLLCQERTEDAKKVFDQIAKWNGKPLIDFEEIIKLQQDILLEKSQEMKRTLSMQGLKEKVRETRLEKVKDFLWRPLVIFPFLWFSSSIVYYGLSFNMKNLNGDPYIKMFFMGLIDLPGYFSGMLFINRYGRKKTFITLLITTTLFLFGIILVQEHQLKFDPVTFSQLMTWLCLLGRFTNAGSSAILACCTAESFPTLNRATSMSFCALAGSFGGIMAPQLAFLGTTVHPSIPYTVFGVLTAVSSLISLLIDDKNGKPLEDS